MAAAWLSSPTGPMTTHFWGPVANWGLSLSAIYDANMLGPEVINERMSATQVVYSSLFMRFAWKVEPRNLILFSCHGANVTAQSNQLRRWVGHTLETQPTEAPAKLQNLGMLAGGAGAFVGVTLLLRKPMQAAFMKGPGIIGKLAAHPAGPFYIHFWAPNFKYALSINNLLDYNRPTDKISVSMMSALSATGLLFMRWSFVITPVNYSLFLVNALLSSTSMYHLGRKFKADYYDKK